MPVEKPVLCGVGVILFNQDGKFLLIKRTSKHAAGMYALPGGWMEFGETPEEAGIREAKEELDVDLKDIKVLGITNNFFPAENIHTISPLVAARIMPGQEPKIMEPHKVEQLVWCDDWDNLPEPIFTKYNQYITSGDLKAYWKRVCL